MSVPYSPGTNPDTGIAKRSRFSRRVSVLFLILGLILSTIAIQVYRVVGDFVDASHWVAQSMDVRQQIILTLASLHDAEASQRAYLISLDAERLADYAATVPRIIDHSAKLQLLVADNPEQTQNAERLEALLDARLASIRHVLDEFAGGGIDAARASKQMMRSRADDLQIDRVGQRMLRYEEALQAARQKHTAAQALRTRMMTIGAILFSILMLGGALVLVLREQRHRLASMQEARSANRDLLRSLSDSQRLGQSLRELAELGEMLQGCRDIDEAARGLAISLPRLLPSSSGSVHLINASQNLIQAIAHWGSGSQHLATLFAPDDCWALRRGHAYPLAGSAPAFICKHLQSAVEEHPEQVHLCLPMIAQGEILGVVSVTSGHGIDSTERSNIIAASESISMALANLKLQETLRMQSLRDPLTGLFNRRYLEASFEREIQRAERRNIPLSVLMLDVDHFKQFNDTFGHDAGDALLAHLGTLLSKIVRSEDVSCRYGGEEFTILMPEADIELAQSRAEEICAAVRNMDVLHRNLSLGKVTISIGVATWGEHGRTPEELLRNADNALYMAKNSGRDQVKLAEILHPRSDPRKPTSSASVSRFSQKKLG
ncbi:MAG TPA: diguanylate cyclase [Dokdonella sp.]|uniref:sensor domain-containing diguanylate cyclase n=1 Tax=Dokdonella sp. TaxID=2291710 RepID=UPI002D80A865|nr:diguanylate cyclase [Dokdonella sp.]HET9032004.1 diguanylate cyclase [Dokdonella sp.]